MIFENKLKQKETLGHLLFMTRMLRYKLDQEEMFNNPNYEEIKKDIEKMEVKIDSILSVLNADNEFVEKEYKKYIELVKQRKEIENRIFSIDNN